MNYYSHLLIVLCVHSLALDGIINTCSIGEGESYASDVETSYSGVVIPYLDGAPVFSRHPGRNFPVASTNFTSMNF